MNSETDFNANESAIAVIGRVGRFPGARTVEQLWENLRNGVESITFHTDDELRARGVSEDTLHHPNFVKASAMLEGIEYFDASFFGYNPREAEMMDPQQRIFLEAAWEALENAGYDPKAYSGLIGVYAGSSLNSYAIFNLNGHSELIEKVGAFQVMLGNEKDFLTMRASYKLDLKGPGQTIQTACSTSLVAVHTACQSLLNHECDMALAGGVAVRTIQGTGYMYQEGGIASPDGHCRAFDADSKGTVFGSGVGLVVLKRLEDALADGDTIHAVIRATAINNDGDRKIGFTAPSVEGQATAIANALSLADVDPETIGYIEAHGTGTELGDPIELEALTKAYRVFTDKKQYCPIGSVKTNIGHLDSAAGVTGLIKVVEALKHREIPASLHFKNANPNIAFADSPFFVNASLRQWTTGETPRRAAVSAFGVGGTNAHAIVEEAPQREVSSASRPWQLFVLSAKTETALEKATDNLSCYITSNGEQSLADVAYTLQVGRQGMNYRRAVVAQNREDLIAVLTSRDSKRVFTTEVAGDKKPIVFMFPGQGAQYPNMGLELYRTESVFRKVVDQCLELLQSHLSLDLRTLLFPTEAEQVRAAELLNETQYTQPALFVIEYALARLWMSWGIRPDAMVGHSVGEYVAACLSGVFALEDALMLIAQRGKLIQSLSKGSMLAVSATEKEIQPYLREGIAIAAVNSPTALVLSGPTHCLDELQKQLDEQDVAARRLHTSHAFHSAMMEPILAPFAEIVDSCRRHAPKIPFLSNLTGAWVTPEEATSAAYWKNHLRGTVRFCQNVQHLMQQDSLFLEIGPGHTLSTFVKQMDVAKELVIPTLPQAKEKKTALVAALEAVGKLWASGADINWKKMYKDETRYRIPLPTYPFERQKYWVEPTSRTETVAVTEEAFRKPQLDEWFYRPTWKQAELTKVQEQLNNEETVLIFADEFGVATMLTKSLSNSAKRVITVHSGRAWMHQDDTYTINPAAPDEYRRLLSELGQAGMLPTRVIHLWGVTLDADEQDLIAQFDRAQDLTFYSLLYLAQAYGMENMKEKVALYFITNNVQSVVGDDIHYPGHSTAIGPCIVIAQEYPHISCVHIDMSFPLDGKVMPQQIVQLLRELDAPIKHVEVALRGRHRFVKTYETQILEANQLASVRIRQEGIYLITGGMGGIGYALAEHLLHQYRAKLVVVGRTELPARERWDGLIADRQTEPSIRTRLEKLLALEAKGADVLALSADVSDLEQMRSVMQEIDRRFGTLDGVFHAAGVPSAGLIQLKTKDMAEAVFAPKARGALVLHTLLKERTVDFLMLFSSLSSISGGVGQVDYCAANAMLDSLAQYHYAKGETHVLTVDWGQWQFDDWEEKVNKAKEIQEEMRLQRHLLGMSFEEGIEALIRSLQSGQPQLAVTPQNLQQLINQYHFMDTDKWLNQLIYAKNDLITEVASDATNEVEEQIALFWRELFGVEKVSVHDDFFMLGGHSLLALQLLSRLKDKFNVHLSINQLFEMPTIAQMAQLTMQAQLDQIEDDELFSLLDEIELLSEEDVEEELIMAAKEGYKHG